MTGITRRDWLLTNACWAQVLRAQSPAKKFAWLDPGAAGEIEAIAETIMPADGTPGARDAGVIWFIDGALAGFDKNLQPIYTDGLRATQARRLALFAGSDSIAALTGAQRTALLTDIESTDFFKAVRRHTVLGYFGHPRHGGNRNGASAKLLGIQLDTMMYQPPFGYYDREAAQ